LGATRTVIRPGTGMADWLIRDRERQWQVGDILEIRLQGQLIDRGVVQEIILNNIYRLDLESGPFEVLKAPEQA
jgi:hypothetical protein